jgi:CRP-like cAMP-binding protein
VKQSSCDVSSCFLCRNSINEWKEVIAQKKETLFYKKGERIFSEGGKVAGVYFLFAGAVKIHKQWKEDKELILRFVAAGDIMGHRGLGAAQVYPVSATALVDTKACFITNDFLEASLRTNQGFTHMLMQFYADELQKAETRMHNRASWEAKARIAHSLLELDTLFGRDAENYIAVPISRQDIASYAGTTYETVFKVLKELGQDGLIGTSAKSIRLEDPEKLKSIIE